MNFHYIPPKYRAKLLDELYEFEIEDEDVDFNVRTLEDEELEDEEVEVPSGCNDWEQDSGRRLQLGEIEKIDPHSLFQLLWSIQLKYKIDIGKIQHKIPNTPSTLATNCTGMLLL